MKIKRFQSFHWSIIASSIDKFNNASSLKMSLKSRDYNDESFDNNNNRRNTVKCFNCLRPDHYSNRCRYSPASDKTWTNWSKSGRNVNYEDRGRTGTSSTTFRNQRSSTFPQRDDVNFQGYNRCYFVVDTEITPQRVLRIGTNFHKTMTKKNPSDLKKTHLWSIQHC